MISSSQTLTIPEAARRLIVFFGVLLAIVLGLSIAGNLMVRSSLNKYKQQIIDTLYKETGFQASLGSLKVDLFSFLEIDDLVLRHPVKPLTITIQVLKIRFSIMEILLGRKQPVETIKSINIYNVGLKAEKMEGTEIIRAFKLLNVTNHSSLPSFKINVSGGNLGFLENGSRIGIRNLETHFFFQDRDQVKGWVGFGMGIVPLELDCLCSANFRYNTGKKDLDLEGTVRKLIFQGRPAEDAQFHVVTDPTNFRVLGLRMSDTFVLRCHVARRTLVSFDCDLHGFDPGFLTGFPDSWTGHIKSGPSGVSDIDADLTAGTDPSRGILNVRISDGKLQQIILEQNGLKKIVFTPARDGSRFSGVFSGLRVLGRDVNGRMDVSSSTSSNYTLRVADLRWGDAVISRNTWISFQRMKSGYSILSKDGEWEGFLDLVSPQSSWFNLNLGLLNLKPVLRVQNVRQTGMVSLHGLVLRISDCSMDVDGRNWCSSGNLKSDLKTGDLNFDFGNGSMGISLSGKGHVNGFQTALRAEIVRSSQVFPFVFTSSRRHGSTALDFFFGKDAWLNLWLSENGDLRAKMDLGKETRWSRARLSGSAQAAGNLLKPKSFSGNGRFLLEGFETKPLIFPRVALSLELSRNSDLKSEFTLTGKDGRVLSGSGNWELTGNRQIQLSLGKNLVFSGKGMPGKRKYDVKIDGFDLSALSSFLEAGPLRDLSGIVNCDLREIPEYVQSTPKLDFHLDITGLHVAGLSFNEFSFKGGFRSGEFRLTRGRVYSTNIAFDFSDGLVTSFSNRTIFGTSFGFQEKDEGGSFSGIINLAGNWDGAQLGVKADIFNLKRNRVDIGRFNQYLVWEKNKGLVRLLATDAGFNGSLIFRPWPSFEIRNMSLDYQVKGEKLFGLDGYYGKSLSLEIKDIMLPCQYLRYLSKDLTFASGTITGSCRISGSSQTPALNGSLTLNDTRLKFSSIIQDVRQINGTIKLEGDTIEFDRIAGLIENRPLNASGKMDLLKGRIQSWDINVEVLTNAPIYIKRANDIQGYISGRINFTKEDEHPLVRGLVYLNRMDITYPFHDMMALSKQKTDLVFDLKIVALDQVTYSQNINDIDESVKPGSWLHLKGLLTTPPSEGDQVTGVLEGVKGTMDYLGTLFTIDHLKLVFSREYAPSTPFVDFSAEAVVKQGTQDVKVTLEGTGLLDNDFNLKLNSDPGLAKKDIIALLGYGQMYSRVSVKIDNSVSEIDIQKANEEDLNRLMLAGLLTLVDQTYQNTLIKPAERRIRKFLHLDKLQIKPSLGENIITKGFVPGQPGFSGDYWKDPLGNGLDNTQIVVGKYLTDFLFVEWMITLKKDDVATMPMYYQHQLGLELDLKSLSFEWKYQPFLLNPYDPTGQNGMQGTVKYQKTF